MQKVPEITHYIFSFLDITSLNSCCLVSKFFVPIGREAILRKAIENIIKNLAPEDPLEFYSFESAYEKALFLEKIIKQNNFVSRDAFLTSIMNCKKHIITKALEKIDFQMNDPAALTPEQKTHAANMDNDALSLEEQTYSLNLFYKSVISVNSSLDAERIVWEERNNSIGNGQKKLNP